MTSVIFLIGAFVAIRDGFLPPDKRAYTILEWIPLPWYGWAIILIGWIGVLYVVNYIILPHPAIKGKSIQSETKDNRIIISTTPEHLSGFYSSGNTSLQSDALLNLFKGKWIKVSGSLGYVGSQKAGYISITLKQRDNAINDQIHVSGLFLQKDFDYLSTLIEGQHIEILGKISAADDSGVLIDNCELIKS